MNADNPSQLKTYPFEFHGKGGEFFKIWIVNILLTIITLGIYSAWAKVRTHRYFYGNTTLDNASFEYLADPVAILKGRIIAVLLFVGYSFLSGVSPIAGFVLLLLFFIATPYIVVRAIRFQHRMTAYKNIRFQFEGGFGDAFMVYLVWPLLSVFTLGLLYPFIHQRVVKFYVANSFYGHAHFTQVATVGAFYKLYTVLFALILAIAIAIGLLITSFGFSLSSLKDINLGTSGLTMIFGLYIGVFLIYFIINAFAKSYILNLIMRNTMLDDSCSFESSLSLRKMVWILFSNALLIAFTLGLAYPWTKVRLAHYRAQNTQMIAPEALDNFIGQHAGEPNAFGEEMGEVFDIDVGI